MKPAPKSPEFEKFKTALRHILTVPKSEIVKRDELKKNTKPDSRFGYESTRRKPMRQFRWQLNRLSHNLTS